MAELESLASGQKQGERTLPIETGWNGRGSTLDRRRLLQRVSNSAGAESFFEAGAVAIRPAKSRK
jgi:hypothetical protein